MPFNSLKKSKGRIAVMVSASGITGAPLHAGYAASKHAVVGLLESVRTELVGTGIRITLLYPEFVRTDIRLHGFQPEHAGVIVCTFDPDFRGQAERIHAELESNPSLLGQLVRVNRPSS